MKTILVTGAAGLIGKAVTEMLISKGYNVIAVDKEKNPFGDAENLSYTVCPITDKDTITDLLNKNKTNVLIHLACTVDNDFPAVLSSEEEKISAVVDKYLYKAAVSAGVGDIMMISTHQIYAPQKTREPIRETMSEKPSSIYAKLKSDSEKALSAALKKADTNGVVMRVCPVYTKDFTDNLKAKVYDPKDGCAFVYGYGDYGYTFTCLYNIVDFVNGILTCPAGISYPGIYNVCDSKPIVAKDIVEVLRSDHKIGAVMSRNYGSDAVKGAAALFGSKAARTDYRYNDLSIACSNISYDNTKAQRISTFRWKFTNTK
ncbi:MAG: NAD(P)-dependent oxidoreductase [Oscillospiraceae bacterium]|nr:NAD(P)-dependent oxidoreductase [Oscillospiraceae bacterium]